MYKISNGTFNILLTYGIHGILWVFHTESTYQFRLPTVHMFYIHTWLVAPGLDCPDL